MIDEEVIDPPKQFDGNNVLLSTWRGGAIYGLLVHVGAIGSIPVYRVLVADVALGMELCGQDFYGQDAVLEEFCFDGWVEDSDDCYRFSA